MGLRVEGSGCGGFGLRVSGLTPQRAPAHHHPNLERERASILLQEASLSIYLSIYVSIYLSRYTPGQRGYELHRVRGVVSRRAGRALAGKLDRFQENHFREFVPESFIWTVYMSRPGTNISICENVSS